MTMGKSDSGVTWTPANSKPFFWHEYRGCSAQNMELNRFLSLGQSHIADSLCSLSLATGRAWSYKELLRDLWAQETEGKAKSYFHDWYQRVIRTKMAPMKKLAKSLKERIDNIVTYCTHGITNAVAEGINS